MRIDVTQLRASFDTFTTETNTALGAVANQLERGEYAEAADTMNTLTQRMAKTSVAMRAILIKGGFIKESS